VLGRAHAATSPARVLVVGDSVPAALSYQPSLEREIAKGLDVVFDLQVCRRLATAGCPYGGRLASSALDVVASAARTGDVLVVDVGYNDDPAAYRGEMARLIRVATSRGVKKIVWVNLSETRSLYRQTNAAIDSEARSHPIVQVADWSSWSSGKPWFRGDGLHLTDSGARGLALMLRASILAAARSAAATSRR